MAAVKFSVQRSVSSGTAPASGLKGWLPIRGRRSFSMRLLRPTSARRTSAAATNRLGLGDKVRLIAGHCDPNRQPLRLVCLCARQPRPAGLADHRPLGDVLTFVTGHQPPEGEPTWCGSEPIDQSRPSVTIP